MTVEEIDKLVALCLGAGIGEFDIKKSDLSVRLRLDTHAVKIAAAEVPKIEAAFNGVRAPGVGIFRLDHPTTGYPVVKPGQVVKRGDTVGVLQIGPSLRPVVAPVDGVLGAALVEDGAVVGYGTPLYPLN